MSKASASGSYGRLRLPWWRDASRLEPLAPEVLHLSSVREATVDGIAAALDLKLIELLPTLGTLEGAGYVERQGDTCRLAW